MFLLLFKNHDIESMNSIARKFEIKVQDLKTIFETFGKSDSLVIDETRPPEFRLRKNIFTIVPTN